jgi:hypothetical protein
LAEEQLLRGQACFDRLAEPDVVGDEDVRAREGATPRPRLRPLDRTFWMILSRVGSRWTEALVVVNARRSSAGIGVGSSASGSGGHVGRGYW